MNARGSFFPVDTPIFLRYVKKVVNYRNYFCIFSEIFKKKQGQNLSVRI